ncbi:MAG TPA: hypothetical protein VF043_04235 [Ktedonobacteraceae bacterium]
MPDQPEITTKSMDKMDKTSPEQAEIVIQAAPASSAVDGAAGFDWPVMGVIIVLAAFFAVTARLHAQPATSLVPVAVLSATGCGLLITASRKLRAKRGLGAFEAGLGGFFVAIFQFIAAITYPGVFDTLSTNQTQLQGFLNTWALILVTSIVFSIVGAALGHLAFAPLRPLPAKPKPSEEAGDVGVEESAGDDANVEDDDTAAVDEKVTETIDTGNTGASQTSRTFISYLIAILLLGLAPTLVGYIFSAAYSSVLAMNGFTLSPYPTLRLLSALLPWQVPAAVGLSGSAGNFIIVNLLWYIPLFFGNPTLFDLQALEPIIFNGAALALLLLVTSRRDSNSSEQSSPMSWKGFLLLEALLGLVIVLPADLWLLQGIKGILQLQNVAIPIRSLQVLNPLTFTLNLLTGPLVCVLIGTLLRRMSKQLFSINARR